MALAGQFCMHDIQCAQLRPVHFGYEETLPDALTGIIGRLTVRPSFLVAKGGITSSDVGTKALQVRKALVRGQILPGIPVWETGEESRFPGLAYVIFPGNVGGDSDLRRIAEMLTGTA